MRPPPDDNRPLHDISNGPPVRPRPLGDASHPISLLKPPSPRAVPAAQLECVAVAADAARRDKQHARADGGGAARPGVLFKGTARVFIDDRKDADYDSDDAAELMSVETAEKQTPAVVGNDGETAAAAASGRSASAGSPDAPQHMHVVNAVRQLSSRRGP